MRGSIPAPRNTSGKQKRRTFHKDGLGSAEKFICAPGALLHIHRHDEALLLPEQGPPQRPGKERGAGKSVSATLAISNSTLGAGGARARGPPRISNCRNLSRGLARRVGSATGPRHQRTISCPRRPKINTRQLIVVLRYREARKTRIREGGGDPK